MNRGWSAGIKSLPATMSWNHGYGIGGALVAMGAAISGYTLYGINQAFSNAPVDLTLLWYLPGILAGGAVVFAGLRMLGASGRVTIDSQQVACRYRNLFWTTAWQVPLASYYGLTLRKEQKRDSDRHVYMEYQIVLTHPDQEKALKLYASRDRHAAQEFANCSTETLGRPIVGSELAKEIDWRHLQD